MPNLKKRYVKPRIPNTMVPTVGHVRDVLVFALRHLAEAGRRGRRVRRVFHGVENSRAVELVRLTLRGRSRRERVSSLTWQVARALGNATPCPSAWWNAKRWQLLDDHVGARLEALQHSRAA